MKLKKSTLRFSSYFLLIFLFTYLFPFSANKILAQTADNLNIFYSLIDSSVIQIIKSIPVNSNNLTIKTNLNDGYSIFENKILADFNKNKRNVSINDSTNKYLIKYSIDNARVTYPEIFRESIFGSWKLQRNIFLSGNYSTAENGILKVSKSFSFTSLDTINYDKAEKFESPSLAFTKGEKPAEPFFSSYLEPIIALGTAATIIYLFFTIRSK